MDIATNITGSLVRLSGDYNRTIVVGDIHGCFSELQTLLEKVGFCSSDLLVSVGDILDRGPDSWRVAKFFRDTDNAYLVKGNHERRVSGTILGRTQPANTQRHTLSRLSYQELYDWAAWLDALPVMIETDHALVAHAQVDPSKALSEQSERHVCGVRAEISLDDSGVPVWFSPRQFEKPLCIGHKSYPLVDLIPGKLYASDTDCCYGGKLTAIIFPGSEIVSVHAERDWFTQSKQQWREELMILSLSNEEVLLQLAESNKDCSSYRRLIDKLNELGLEQFIEEGAELLQQRFGLMPAEGKERGQYLRRINSELKEKMAKRIVVRLLEGRYPTVDSLLSDFKSYTLDQLAKYMLKVRLLVLL